MPKAGPDNSGRTPNRRRNARRATSEETTTSAGVNGSNTLEQANNCQEEVQAAAPVKANDSSEDKLDILKLTERLRHILQCNVCLEVPHPDEINQCSKGHVICNNCVTRILTEARLSGRDAQCPHCRILINWNDLTRNMAVRQTLWELPKQCTKCNAMIDYKSLVKHMEEECEKRSVPCKYSCLGCLWTGPRDESALHEKNCVFPNKSGEEILEDVLCNDVVDRLNVKHLALCYRQFSAQRIYYENIDFRWTAYPATNFGEYILNSKPFYAFKEQWKISLCLNIVQRRVPDEISYSLTLLSLHTDTYPISYFALMPSSRTMPKQSDDIKLLLHKQTYTPDQLEGKPNLLPLKDSEAICRFLSMPVIQIRIWMFLE